jgi:hypothetical protein
MLLKTIRISDFLNRTTALEISGTRTEAEVGARD